MKRAQRGNGINSREKNIHTNTSSENQSKQAMHMQKSDTTTPTRDKSLKQIQYDLSFANPEKVINVSKIKLVVKDPKVQSANRKSSPQRDRQQIFKKDEFYQYNNNDESRHNLLLSRGDLKHQESLFRGRYNSQPKKKEPTYISVLPMHDFQLESWRNVYLNYDSARKHFNTGSSSVYQE